MKELNFMITKFLSSLLIVYDSMPQTYNIEITKQTSINR